MERLLHDTLSSAGRDVLYLSQVSLKETSACLCAPGSLQLSSILPVFDSTAFVLGEHEHACVAGGANPGEGASAHEDIEGLVQKVALLEGELAEARQAREAVKEKFHSLSDLSVDGMRLLVVSEKKQWGQLKEGMWVAALHHAKVVGELAALWVAVSSTTELVLGCSLDEIFRVKVMDKLVAEFQRLEKLCLQLELLGMRICDLLLGLPLG
jgi:hypothetical protein